MLRLINLYTLFDKKHAVSKYVDTIYKTLLDFECGRSHTEMLRNIKNKNTFNFIDCDCTNIVYKTKNNMLYIYIAYCIIHALRESSFLEFSKTDSVDGVCVFSAEKVEASKATIQYIVGNIVKRIALYVDILKIARLTNLDLDEKIIYRYIFYIINMLCCRCVDSIPIVKIKKIIRKDGNKIMYNNIVKNSINIKQSIEDYINVFYTKPTVIYLKDVALSCPGHVVYAIRLIKQIKSKKHTTVTNKFIEAINNAMHVEYFIDYNMLDKTFDFAKTEISKLRVAKEHLLKSFVDLKINNVTLTSGSVESMWDNLSKLIYTVIDNESAENNVRTKQVLNTNSLDNHQFKDGVVTFLNEKIRVFNKKNKLNIELLNINSDIEYFINKNKNIFYINKRRTASYAPRCASCDYYTTFKPKYLIDGLSWDVVKSTCKDDYVEYSKRIEVLRHMGSNVDSINSRVAGINYFLDFYNFIKSRDIKSYYFLIFADSRGRFYVKSPVSIQANWLYRYIYHFGSLSLSQYENYKHIIRGSISNEDWLDVTSALYDINIYDLNLVNVFFSIGLIFKSRISSVNGLRSYIQTVKFGIYVYRQYGKNTEYLDSSLDPDDALATTYYIHIINNVTRGIINKWYIIKDTTASVNQHSAKLLGCKYDSLKYINLDASIDGYYDTYDLFKNRLADHLSLLGKQPIVNLLSRGLLKKLIMTISYSIGSKSAYRDWITTIDTLNFKQTDRKLLIGGFYIIYSFLKNDSVGRELLYKKSKHDFLKKLALNDFFILNDIKIPIKYFRLKSEDLKYRSSGKVTTISFNSIDESYYDDVKTNSSMFVNCVHALDAIYLRRIITLCHTYGIEIGPIHDGYCVAFFHCDMLVAIAKDSFIINEVVEIFGDINIDLEKIELSDYIIV